MAGKREQQMKEIYGTAGTGREGIVYFGNVYGIFENNVTVP